MLKTRWRDVLAATPGTEDYRQLSLLHSAKGTFSLYARLRTQLLFRSLEELSLSSECPEYPFCWDHVVSNDFFFEDAMRIAHEICLVLKDKSHNVRQLQRALGLVNHLLMDPHVEKWQTISILPHWLRMQRLRAQKKEIEIRYIEAFFHDFVNKRNPIDTFASKNLEIIMWLSQKSSSYKPWLSWVRAEMLFARARGLGPCALDAVRAVLH